MFLIIAFLHKINGCGQMDEETDIKDDVLFLMKKGKSKRNLALFTRKCYEKTFENVYN